MTGFVHLARLGRPFGTQGELHLQLLTDRPEQVLAAPAQYTLLDGRKVEVEALTRRGARWYWKLALPPETGDRRAAAARFTNAVVVAPAAALPARGAEEFSEYELTGMKVVETDGRKRGEIVGIVEGKETDTWLVRDATGKEHDLLARRRYVLNVDRAARVVTIAPDAWAE